MNRDKKGRFASIKSFAKKAVMWYVTRCLIPALIVIAIMGVSVHAQSQVINTVTVDRVIEVQSKELPPILERVAKCESNGQQFDKNGKLMKHVNVDGTVDYGKFMINDYHWEAKAVAMGWNIYEEKGNTEMAKWLYANRGTQDWSASFKCWSK